MCLTPAGDAALPRCTNLRSRADGCRRLSHPISNSHPEGLHLMTVEVRSFILVASWLPLVASWLPALGGILVTVGLL